MATFWYGRCIDCFIRRLLPGILTSDDDAVATHINYKSATDTQQIESYRTTSLGHNEDAKLCSTNKYFDICSRAMHLYSSYDAFTNGPSGGQASNSKKSKFDLVYNPNLKQPELRFSIALTKFKIHFLPIVIFLLACQATELDYDNPLDVPSDEVPAIVLSPL